MTAAGAAWRRKFQIDPKPTDTDPKDAQIRRLEIIVSLRDREKQELRDSLESARRFEMDARRQAKVYEAELTASTADETIKAAVRTRTIELEGEIDRAQAMNRDLRAIIETHNAANGQELRDALKAERDEAVRLLRVARADESKARQEAFETRQFLANAQRLIEGFKAKLDEIDDALGERVQAGYSYQS